MENTKKWYKSKGVVGGLISTVAVILMLTGIADISAEEQATLTSQIVEAIDKIAILGGTLFAIYGRITAKERIE